jgi:pimeloyl-ACP methyl ester carboxylesterase
VPPSPFAEPERVDAPVPGGVLGGGLWPAATVSAPTVVAIHDLTANHLVWGHLAVALGGRFTLAAPDLRGRARSADLPGPGGLERHADEVAAFIEAVTAGPVVLVGHGYGAWVAARVAERPPDACAGLVLVDPVPDRAAPAPFPSSVEVAFGAGLRRLGRTYPNRDAYLAEWGAHPAFRLGVDRLTRRALLADLHGSGFLWRPSVDAELVAADAQEVVAARPDSRDVTPAGIAVELLRPAAAEGADHETLVLGDAGADAVAAAVERLLAGPPAGAPEPDVATTD